jgi:hypothetical protein
VTDPAQAFLNHGNVDQWTRGAGIIAAVSDVADGIGGVP